MFDGPVTNLLSILCLLTEVLSRANAKGGKGLNGFKFGTFTGRFQSDGAASMVEKRLISILCRIFFFFSFFLLLN